MRAVIVDKVRSLKVVEREMPKLEGNLVLVKVAYSSICGSDLGYWKGELMLGRALGHEFSGTVADPGSSGFQVGEEVCGMELNPCGKCAYCQAGQPNICPHQMDDAPGITRDGSYAEYVAVRADMLRRVPEGVSLVEAALAEPVSVSYHGVNRAQIQKGERVIIMGGGPIGIFAAACAKWKGAEYAAVVETDPYRIELARALPFIDQVFDANAPDYLKQIKAVQPQKFKVALDCTGRESTVCTAINLVQNGGRVITMGLHDNVQKLPTTKLLLKEISLIPSSFFVPEEFDEVLGMMARKEINVLPCVSDVRPFEAAQISFEQLDSPVNKGMKILLRP